MKVLLVSRNDGARAWIRRALGPRWEYAEAPHGLEALDIAKEGGIDLVIADESTEPYGAFGLARDLKILPDAPRVVILLDRAQDAWLAKWSGGDRWLVQPVDPVELSVCAREVLSAVEPEGVGTAADAGPATGDGAGELERVHATSGTPYTEARHTDR